MTQQEALEILARGRTDQIVVTTMTSVGIWPKLSDSPLDFHYLPSAMGHAPALGLGLALAQPSRGVIVLNGDGCMLMSLGSLVTIANHPAKVFLIVLDNALYEVTGGQRTAGSGHVDFAQMARAAGMPACYTFDNVEDWQRGLGAVLSGPAPAMVWLKVEARYGQKTPPAPRKMADQIARLKTALGT